MQNVNSDKQNARTLIKYSRLPPPHLVLIFIIFLVAFLTGLFQESLWSWLTLKYALVNVVPHKSFIILPVMSLFYASVKPSQLVLMVAAAAKKEKLISINYLFVAEVAQ